VILRGRARDLADLGQTPPAEKFSQISAGGSHVCGIKPDGSVACWGIL
jgi:alpha-tubulin suppressor-like RCC1 family protein